MKRIISLLMTVVLLVLAVVAAVPSAFASAVDLADSAYSLATPSFKVERGAKGVLVTWNADSGVDHYRVYHKTADGWSKVADNIKVGYYFDTSVVKGKSYTFTVRGLNSSDSFVTDFNRNGVSVTFTPDSDKYLLGDTDMDGMVTVMDSTHIQRKLAELKTDEYKYINYLGDSDNDGLNITDATRIQRYIAQIPIPYPVGGKLLGLSGAPTEAPTEKPTEVVVDAPSEVKVVEGSSGKKVYEKVTKYQLKSNLNSTALTVDLSDSKTFFWKSAVEDELWISSHIEYLSDGKVRLYFAPNAYEKITSLKGALLGESGKWYVFDIPVSTIKNGSGYYDYQMPEVASQSSNPSIKVSWGESSNADSYEVRALDAKGNAVSSVVRTGSTSATVTLNTADAGTYSVEVKAVKGNKSATAKGTFSLSTEFITETEGSTIKVPVVSSGTAGICNHAYCGAYVSGGRVKEQIIPFSTQELKKYPVYKYTYLLKGYSWARPDLSHDNYTDGEWLTCYRYDLGEYYWHPLDSDDPEYKINYVNIPIGEGKYTSREFFTIDEMKEEVRNSGVALRSYPSLTSDIVSYSETEIFRKANGRAMTFGDLSEKQYETLWEKHLEGFLDLRFLYYHYDFQKCNTGIAAWHTETRSFICGLQTIYIPATGYTKVSFGTNQPYEPPTESPSEKPVEEPKLGSFTGLNCKVLSNGISTYEQLVGYGFRFRDAEINQWRSAMFNIKEDGLSNTAFGMECSFEYIIDNSNSYSDEALFTLKMDPVFVENHIKKPGDLMIVIDNGSDTLWYPAPMTYAGGTKKEVVYQRITLNKISDTYPKISLSWNKVPNADSYYVLVLGGATYSEGRHLMKYIPDVKTTSCTFSLSNLYKYATGTGAGSCNEYTIYVVATRGKQTVSISKTFTYSELNRPYNADDPYIYIDRLVEWK